MHWKKLFNNRFIGSWDLEGRDVVTMTIDRYEIETVNDTKGEQAEVPVLYFSNSKTGKGMVLNKTNAAAIAAQHGDDPNEWSGKQVGLVVQQVSAFGSTVDAIRITRPNAKKQNTKAAQAVLEQTDAE